MSLEDDKLDPTQIEQKVTYFRSKLAKYKAWLDYYENNSEYSQLRLLKLENIKLVEEKEHISLQLQKTNEKFQEMIEDLKGQLQFYYDQENELNNSLLNQNHEIEKLTKQNTDYQETISTVQSNLEDYKIKMESMNKESHSLNAHLTQKQTEVENLQDKNNDLLTENHKQIEKINEYESINEGITFQIEKLNKEIQIYENRIKDMEKLSNELKAKNSQLETYNEKVENERQSDKILQKEQNEQINSLRNDLKLIKNSKEQLEKQNLDLQKQKTNLMLKLEELEKTDKLHAQSEKDLEQQIHHYLKKIEEGQLVQQDLEKLNAELQKENILLSSSVDQLNQGLKHALLRLLVPRHPPCALTILTVIGPSLPPTGSVGPADRMAGRTLVVCLRLRLRQLRPDVVHDEPARARCTASSRSRR